MSEGLWHTSWCAHHACCAGQSWEKAEAASGGREKAPQKAGEAVAFREFSGWGYHEGKKGKADGGGKRGTAPQVLPNLLSPGEQLTDTCCLQGPGRPAAWLAILGRAQLHNGSAPPG